MKGLRELNEAKKESSMKDIFNDKLKELGLGVKIKKDQNDKFIDLGTGVIDKKSLNGHFGEVFKEVRYDIKGGYNNDLKRGRISIHYDWDTLRGGNGYQVQYLYNRGEWTREM